MAVNPPGPLLGSTALPPRSCVQYRRNSEHRPAPRQPEGGWCVRTTDSMRARAVGGWWRSARCATAASGTAAGCARSGAAAKTRARPVGVTRRAGGVGTSTRVGRRATAGSPAGAGCRSESDASGYPRVVAELHTARHDEGGGTASAVSGARGVVAPPGCRALRCLRCCLRALRPMGTSAPATSRRRRPGKEARMIAADQEARVLRLYHVEKWRVHTIARQLGMHHATVRRVLARAGIAVASQRRWPSKIDPYVPFIQATLAEYPLLIPRRGFTGDGAAAWLRRRCGSFPSLGGAVSATTAGRSLPPRLRTLPGEQGQVDWASFGKLVADQWRVAAAARSFVMVLSWSRSDLPALFRQRPRHGRTSCAAIRRPCSPGRAVHESCSTTTSRARCSSGAAPRCACIQRCWRSPPHWRLRNPGRSPSPGATRRGGSKGLFSTCAGLSSPDAPSPDLDQLQRRGGAVVLGAGRRTPLPGRPDTVGGRGVCAGTPGALGPAAQRVSRRRVLCRSRLARPPTSDSTATTTRCRTPACGAHSWQVADLSSGAGARRRRGRRLPSAQLQPRRTDRGRRA